MPGNPQTANLNGYYNVLDKHGSAGTYFDTCVFSQPQGVVFGNTGRNQFRGPGAWNIDFSLFRAFPIGRADRRFEFRVEVFNLLNHPNWGNPDGDVNSCHFRSDVLRRHGARDAGTGERQIRLGVRFQF